MHGAAMTTRDTIIATLHIALALGGPSSMWLAISLLVKVLT